MQKQVLSALILNNVDSLELYTSTFFNNFLVYINHPSDSSIQCFSSLYWFTIKFST